MNIYDFIRDKRNRIPIIVIGIAILFTAGLFGYFVTKFVAPHSIRASANVSTSEENDKNPQNMSTSQVRSDSKEMRGVWIASVHNINYPSQKALGVEEMAYEIDVILDNAKKAGLNTVFFQVRPSSDALYKSEIFPWSEYLTGEQGKAPENDFDPLRYAIDRAHEKGIDLHAWINPYRITMGSKESPLHDVNELAPTNPARLHPEYTVAYADGKLYYNPGLPEVRKLCTDGVAELLDNYPDLDGIHFDDYFYPYPVQGAEFDDADAYAKSKTELSLGDWRRENVNSLIRETYAVIKSKNPNCRFGVSPFGIWANSSSVDTPIIGSESAGLESYFSLYCDPIAWANEKTVDYLAPQIYWSFNTQVAPFDNIARWWNASLDGTGVDLYIGHAVYKIEDYGENEIPIQVEFGRNLLSYKGSIFYGYADIAQNTLGISDALSKLYESEKIYSSITPSNEQLSINVPTFGESTTASTTYMLGSSDPAFPVYYNNRKLSRTKNGFFQLYETLTDGENRFKLTQNGREYVHMINKSMVDDTAVRYDNYMIGPTSPGGEVWVMSGEKLNITVQAPAGSTVTAYLGDSLTAELQPVINSSEADELTAEVYRGSIDIPSSAEDNSSRELGELRFVATNGVQTASKTVGKVKELAKDAYIYAEVVNDYAYIKLSPKSSFYNDYTPASIGMRDYVTGLEDNYYRLKFGGYVSKDDVKITEGETLLYSIISKVSVSTKIGSTLNNKDNATEIRFTMQEKSPVDIKVSGSRIKVTFYEVYNLSIPESVISPNPMVSSIIGNVTENKAEFDIELKNEMNYYGCNGVYEDGAYVLRLNNPQTLSEGDKPLEGKTIYVDAGHGGTDIGTSGPVGKSESGANESDLNLAVALELEKLLTQSGATVVMTRTDDTTVTIDDRIKMFAQISPDLLVSVHHNSIEMSANATKVRGTLALYSHEGGKLLAESIASSMSSMLGKLKRKTSYQKLAVARNHRYPSALCEICFLSNAEEYQWAITEGNSKRSAQAIHDGIIGYYKAQQVYIMK